MRIEDNNFYNREDFNKDIPQLLVQLENQTVQDLYKKHIIIFPNSLSDSEDLNKKSRLFAEYGSKIKVGNLIGFLGYNTERLEIHSRFANEKQAKDYFLIYLIQKAISINLTNLDIDSFWQQPVWYLVQYLFPYYLNEALKKGIFKQYNTFKYNDLNIRGTIDFSRLIKDDIPFINKIAYTSRELTDDNPLIELVRHTIEYLRNSNDRKIIMNADKLTHNNIRSIIKLTPNYNFKKRKQIINYNLRHPFHQIYFKEYRNLQLICLLILRHRGIKLNLGNSSITGFLFDVSWLWENYLTSVLGDMFIHLDNRKQSDFISVYQDLYDQNEYQKCCPDFLNENQHIVLDAKYKIYDDQKLRLDDLRQLISYGYLFTAKNIGVIYPSKYETNLNVIGALKGYSAQVVKISLKIPQNYKDYTDFVTQMKTEEQKVHAYLKSIIRE
ncbi:5-methylcytosine restriction system specificity protein McrC [Lactobacillus sp. A27]|uniref:5-methylcytosine restriction system specificity protein McrC n=1 Tax=Lactobacillus sp. A27 TaxID=2796363 RepID=UPI00191E1608|nr:3-isopropylmalate dehydrogenase [Lactobacillus sp. A27]MBL1060260.1 3-isopropylmalate dehydrogenase [Lactobacillus sp. A27]